MIDARKKLSDIAFQNPRGSRVIARDNSCVLVESVHGAIRAFIKTAGVRIENERTVEIGIQYAVDGMMQ